MDKSQETTVFKFKARQLTTDKGGQKKDKDITTMHSRLKDFFSREHQALRAMVFFTPEGC